MKRGKLITAIVFLVSITAFPVGETSPQSPIARFKSGVDVVRVTAVVRDKRGRFVKGLTMRDFEVFDDGLRRRITDFHSDVAGVSVALLFDVSGSMEALMGDARHAASGLLDALERNRDEAAVFTFDTRLDEIAPFSSQLSLPRRLETVIPFGATSLHDAIAKTAERAATREGRRRAVVVFTDGNDTASRLTPGEVSSRASAIDIPIYVVGVVSEIDDPAADVGAPARGAQSGALSDLANWTGGRTFIVSAAEDRLLVGRQILDELRHQYLIAFESSGKPGWHPLEVRARSKDLIVRARSGYIAGQSRPNS